MIGIPLNATAQIKLDKKHAQNGQLESWVLCGHF